MIKTKTTMHTATNLLSQTKLQRQQYGPQVSFSSTPIMCVETEREKGHCGLNVIKRTL